MPSFSEANKRAPYAAYAIQTKYRWKSGLVQVPVAQAPAPGGEADVPCEIVRLHAPYGYKEVRWDMARLGELPECPLIEPDDDFQQLDDAEINIAQPQPQANGELLYAAAGVYRYLLKKPLTQQKGLFGSGNAVVGTSPTENRYGPEAFTSRVTTK